jgi:hypothetical protein
MCGAKNRYLFWSGVSASCGALLHLLIPLGGPEWCAFFGAPRGLVQMARNGDLHAPISCVLIATLLICFAAYAFSGAGLLRRLPLLRGILLGIASILILRGLAFIPLILWRADALANICGDCRSINIFTVVTSLLCLGLGLGYAVGACKHWREFGIRVWRDVSDPQIDK